jgi:hypothetical protein
MVPTNEVQERMRSVHSLAVTEVLHALTLPSLSIAGVSALEAGSICTFVLVKPVN